MKIYKVAHENIICPKEYRKIEITKEDVEGYIERSVAYDDMLNELNINMTDEEIIEIMYNWLEKSERRIL